MGLLKTCPDSVAIRKELLVATRNYLVTVFRRAFFKYVPLGDAKSSIHRSPTQHSAQRESASSREGPCEPFVCCC